MSEDEAQFDREGIYIERDLADSIAIEEELDANVVAPYEFPSPTRRRLSGWVFLFFALFTPFAMDGGWAVGAVFVALAVWQFVGAWPLNIDEHEAMSIAGRNVEFPVGHASAAVRFQGWRSKPRWSVVLYSAADPPDQRALVVIDAVTGGLLETPFVEDVAGV